MRSYQINYSKATNEDDLREVARIIYGTDPYIYPSWYSTAREFADAITPHMCEPGFVFHYDNIYLAKLGTKPVAALAIISNKSQLDYDYQALCRESSRVINEYILPTVHEAQALPDRIACGLALCVDPTMRQQKIAEQLFRYALIDLKTQGIDTLYFDCLRDNQPALNLYQKLGFSIVDQGLGFKKTGDSEEVPIVIFSGTFAS